GCTAGAERGDAGIQRVGIAALEGRNDLVIALRRVEIIGELDDDIVVAAGHRMPPLDLGHGMRGRSRNGKRNSSCGRRAEVSKVHQIPPVWTVMPIVARYQRRMTCK